MTTTALWAAGAVLMVTVRSSAGQTALRGGEEAQAVHDLTLERAPYVTTGQAEARKLGGRHWSFGSSYQWYPSEDDDNEDADSGALEEEEAMYEDMGCFDFPRRGVPLYALLDSEAMSTTMCFEHCVYHGAAFMATQWGRLCWCGRGEELDYYIGAGEGLCNMSCTGDEAETCGGPRAFDLYRVAEVYTGPTPISPEESTPSPVMPQPVPSPTPEPITPDETPSTPRPTPSPVTPETPRPTPSPVRPETPRPTPSPVTPETPRPTPSPVPETPRPITEPEPAPLPSGGPDGELGKLLELHNAVRCMHGASPLTWSSSIAAFAKAYADKTPCGSMVHNQNRNGYGENISICWGRTNCFDAARTMVGFYDEEVNNGPVTGWGGHATQILWKDSKEVGCGLASCETGGTPYEFLVCNYDPPGNYNNNYEEEVEAASKSAQECGYST